MTICLRAVVCLSLALSAPAARATDDMPEPWSRKITLHLRDVTLGEAIKQVYARARVRYVVDPAIAPVLAYERRTVDVDDAPFYGVIAGLFDSGWISAPLGAAKVSTSGRSDDLYRIQGWNVSVDADGEPVDKVLKQVFDGLEFNFAFSHDAVGSKPISYHVKDRPFTEVIASLLAQSEFRDSLSLKYDRGVFWVKRKGWKPASSSSRMSFRLRDMALPDAVRPLTAAAGKSCIMEDLSLYRVHFEGEELPFRTAFERLLRTYTSNNQLPITYRVSGDVIALGKRIEREYDK